MLENNTMFSSALQLLRSGTIRHAVLTLTTFPLDGLSEH